MFFNQPLTATELEPLAQTIDQDVIVEIQARKLFESMPGQKIISSLEDMINERIELGKRLNTKYQKGLIAMNEDFRDCINFYLRAYDLREIPKSQINEK